LHKKEGYYKKNQDFVKGPTKNIKYISTQRNQAISLATGLIPFLEHDDANRALMGSNMQRQAVPLKNSEIALIEIGTEGQISKASQLTKVATKSGTIEFVSLKKIIIKLLLKNWSLNNNNSTAYKVKKRLIKQNNNNFLSQQLIHYPIDNARKSNQGTFIKQSPLIKQKEWVKKGQIITNGPSIKNGRISLGKNILIGYMGWEGYNFEDAIVINERLVDEDIFTSIHTKRQKIFIVINEKEEVRISN